MIIKNNYQNLFTSNEVTTAFSLFLSGAGVAKQIKLL